MDRVSPRLFVAQNQQKVLYIGSVAFSASKLNTYYIYCL